MPSFCILENMSCQGEAQKQPISNTIKSIIYAHVTVTAICLISLLLTNHSWPKWHSFIQGNSIFAAWTVWLAVVNEKTLNSYITHLTISLKSFFLLCAVFSWNPSYSNAHQYLHLLATFSKLNFHCGLI